MATKKTILTASDIKKQIGDLHVKLEKFQSSDLSKAEKTLAKLQKAIASATDKQKKAKAKLDALRSKHKTNPSKSSKTAVEKAIDASKTITAASKELRTELAGVKAALKAIKDEIAQAKKEKKTVEDLRKKEGKTSIKRKKKAAKS